MNLGLYLKSMRETWPLTFICGLGLLLFEVLVTYVLWDFQEHLNDQIFQIAFVQRLIESLLGSELGGQLDPRAAGAFAWVHPVVLAILWAHEITFATRLPAGETDRGTIDLLFGMPVSRWGMFISETAAWLTSGLIIVAGSLLGSFIGRLLIPEEARLDQARTLMVIANLFAMYLAVGGIAWLVSSFSSRRGWAVAIAFGIVVASFFLNFLAQFWEPAQMAQWLSALDYYKPMPIVRDGQWPVVDLAVLLCSAAMLWTAAGVVFSRRDICTV